MTNLYDVDLNELLDFAAGFSNLGDAVGDQVKELVDAYQRDRLAELELNSNAVALAKERLGGTNELLDEALAAYEAMDATGGFRCDDLCTF